MDSIFNLNFNTAEYLQFAQNHIPIMIMTIASLSVWVITTLNHQRKSFLITADQAMIYKKQGLGILDIRVDSPIELIGTHKFDMNKNRTGDFVRFQKKGVIIVADGIKEIKQAIDKFQENGYVVTYGLLTREWINAELPIKSSNSSNSSKSN